LSTNNRLPRWQLFLAIFGFIVWLALISSAEFIRQRGWAGAYQAVAGYSLGYIVAFSGVLFWEIAQGRGSRLLDPHPFFRWFSYISLALIFLLGLASLIADIFGQTDWRYNIGSLLAGIAVGIGLFPAIEKYDQK